MNPSANERVSGLLVWLLLLVGGVSTWRVAHDTVADSFRVFWALPSLAAFVAAVVVPLVFLVVGFAWLKAPASIGIQRLMVLVLLAYHGLWFGFGLRADNAPTPLIQAKRPAREVQVGPDFVAINRNLAVVAARLKQQQPDLKRLELSLGPHWNLHRLTATASAALGRAPWSDEGVVGQWAAVATADEKRGDVTLTLQLKAQLRTDTLALVRWITQSKRLRQKIPLIASFDKAVTVEEVMLTVRRSREDFQKLRPRLELPPGQDTLRFSLSEPRRVTTGSMRLSAKTIDVALRVNADLSPSEFAIGVAFLREKLHQMESKTPTTLRRLEGEAAELLNSALAGFEFIER